MARQLVAGDFDWDIQPEDGYLASRTTTRTVRLSSSTTSQEHSPPESSWTSSCKNDCVSTADDSLAFINTTSGDELDIELDIIRKPSQTPSYQDLNGSSPSSDSASA
jgi:hypothetical protein